MVIASVGNLFACSRGHFRFSLTSRQQLKIPEDVSMREGGGKGRRKGRREGGREKCVLFLTLINRLQEGGQHHTNIFI